MMPRKINAVELKKSPDFPANIIYNKFTPEQIRELCEIDTPINKMFRIMPKWETMHENMQRFYRLKAYWTLRGAEDPGFAANIHTEIFIQNDEKFKSECEKESLKNGWPKPKWFSNLHDLEKEFIPIPKPNINLIIRRCPQMGMIHALRGDVCEPYWWAALSITEHATPNLSRECSDGYPGFTDKELSERINRIHNEKRKPALCSRLNDVNGDICSACKYQGVIKTPIALGFEHEPRVRSRP